MFRVSKHIVKENKKSSVLLHRCNEIIANLLNNYYCELKDFTFQVKIVRKTDYLAAHYDLPGKKKKLFVSYSLRKATKDKIIAGCLAHELEHICYSKSKNVLFRLIENFRHLVFPNDLSHHEREIDLRVIERGLGKELYALMKFHDKYYESYNESDGLTKAEIKGKLSSKLDSEKEK
jgi:hypothetical protein